LDKKVSKVEFEKEVQEFSADTQVSQPSVVQSRSEHLVSEPLSSESPRNVVARATLDLPSTLRQQSSTGDMYSQPMDSDKYLYGVLYGCVVMLLYKYSWFLQLCPIPIFIYVVKHTGVCSVNRLL
jgi:hypothetical protein